MASIANDPGGRRRILFHDADGKRRAIRLGKAPEWKALQTKTHVEHLVMAKRHELQPPAATAAWLAEQPEAITAKLVAAGLVAAKPDPEAVELAAFIDAYVAGPRT